MLSLFCLLFSIYLTNASTLDTERDSHSPSLKLSVNIQKNNRTYPVQEDTSYGFRNDGEQITMNCILKCSGSMCNEGHKYSLHFYVHKNHDKNKTVTVTAETPGTISRTFTLHRNDTEIVCRGYYHDKGHLIATSPARVRLQYVRPHAAPGREPRLLNPLPLIITPSYFKDTGKTFALFTCTAQMQGIALLSWQQMKGSEHIILKTVMPLNHTNYVMHDTLNKTLTESDRDTKLFCAARYILDGPSLSNRLLSKIIILKFNRTVESLPQGTRELSLTKWMAIVGAIIVTAVVVIILLSVILRYRIKVKAYERDEQIRNRPALIPPPPTENVYDQVYGHGAGLKRPRIRPTEKRH